MEEIESQPQATQKRRKLVPVLIGAGLAVMLVVGGLLIWQHVSEPGSLLPAAVVKKVSGFTPYFYEGKVPAGYVLDTSKISWGSGTLIIPLDGADDTGIVITEQAMPAGLSRETVQQNGTSIITDYGKASINDVEGRMIGTLIPTDRSALILLSGSGNTDKNELTVLLQQLKPVGR